MSNSNNGTNSNQYDYLIHILFYVILYYVIFDCITNSTSSISSNSNSPGDGNVRASPRSIAPIF